MKYIQEKYVQKSYRQKFAIDNSYTYLQYVKVFIKIIDFY